MGFSVYVALLRSKNRQQISRLTSHSIHPVKVPRHSTSGKGHGPRRRQFDNGQTLAANNRQADTKDTVREFHGSGDKKGVKDVEAGRQGSAGREGRMKRHDRHATDTGRQEPRLG